MKSDNIFVQKGDIIVFDNKHKIFCGDCTRKESYSFMQEKATLCFTSPPYNVGKNNYGSTAKAKTQKYISKESDIKDEEEYLEMINNAFKNALEKSEYVFFNVAHGSGNKKSLIDFMYENKDYFVDTIIWVKNTTLPVIEPNVLNNDFEYIYIFTNNKDNGKHIKIGQEFRGNISNVIKCDRNSKNKYGDIHKALFPLKLCDEIINKFTNENDIVLDCFSGLGTNLISCIKNNRIYRGIELEPLYCQETINRYLEYKMEDYDIKIVRDGKVIPFSEFKDKIIREYSIFTV